MTQVEEASGMYLINEWAVSLTCLAAIPVSHEAMYLTHWFNSKLRTHGNWNTYLLHKPGGDASYYYFTSLLWTERMKQCSLSRSVSEILKHIYWGVCLCIVLNHTAMTCILWWNYLDKWSEGKRVEEEMEERGGEEEVWKKWKLGKVGKKSVNLIKGEEKRSWDNDEENWNIDKKVK